jgi:hypothetical protein
MTLPTQPQPVGEVYSKVKAFLLASRNYESEEFMRMAMEWNRVENDLQMAIDAVTFEIYSSSLEGKVVDAAMVRKLERMQSLLAQSQDRISKFYTKAEEAVREGQAWHISQGLAKGVSDIQDAYAIAGIYAIKFDMLPFRAIENMVGFLGDGSPLGSLLRTDYAETATDISKLLVDGITQGKGPRETAVMISRYMRGNLERAMTVARTEQIRAFRVANVAQYQESGVIATYTRRSAFSDTSCMACIAADGRVYPVSVQFGDHPKGMCFTTANVRGVNPPNVLTGIEWFTKQPEDIQQSIMGSGHYDAWKSGKFQLKDIAQIGHDEKWGEQIRVKPLAELVGGGGG